MPSFFPPRNKIHWEIEKQVLKYCIEHISYFVVYLPTVCGHYQLVSLVNLHQILLILLFDYQKLWMVTMKLFHSVLYLHHLSAEVPVHQSGWLIENLHSTLVLDTDYNEL